MISAAAAPALGQYRLVNAWRKSLAGVVDGPATPVFWNVDKSG